MSTGKTAIAVWAVICGACVSCSSPELALRDFRAIHDVETRNRPAAETSSEKAGQKPEVLSARETEAPGNEAQGDVERRALGREQAVVRYRAAALLYGAFDRCLFESGLPSVLPEFEAWIGTSEEALDEPEELAVELLMEIESADPADVRLNCRTLAVLGGFLLHDPAPLVRRRCAAILARIAAGSPHAEGMVELEPRPANLRRAALVQQIREDLSERRMAEKEGRPVDEAMLARHRKPIAELRTLRSSNREAEMRLLGEFATELEENAPAVLRAELEKSASVLCGDLARRQIAFALQKRDADPYVRSELVRAWIVAERDAGLAALVEWCGTDDAEAVRRTLIAELARFDLETLRASGALAWLAVRADDDRALSSLDAARALRRLSGLDLHAGEGWTTALAPAEKRDC